MAPILGAILAKGGIEVGNALQRSLMNNSMSDPKAIFLVALEKESPGERARYLDESCQENSDLRSRVEQLLRAHEHAGKFLGGAAATVSPEQREVSTDAAAKSEGDKSAP